MASPTELQSPYPTELDFPTGAALEALIHSTLGMPASGSSAFVPKTHIPTSMAQTYAADAPRADDLCDMIWPQITHSPSPSALDAFTLYSVLLAPTASSSVAPFSSPFQLPAAASSTHPGFNQNGHLFHAMPQQREFFDFAGLFADFQSEAWQPFDPPGKSYGNPVDPATVLVDQSQEQQLQLQHDGDVPSLPHSLSFAPPPVHNPVRSMSATALQLYPQSSPLASPLPLVHPSPSRTIPSDAPPRMDGAVHSPSDASEQGRRGDYIGDHVGTVPTTKREPTQAELNECDRQCAMEILASLGRPTMECLIKDTLRL